MRNKILTGCLALSAVAFSAFTYHAYLKGVDTASMDKSADPRQDFYQYANGTWVKKNPVPPSEARWTSFNVLAEKNTALLHKVLRDASAEKSPAAGSNREKIGMFYRIAMDTVKLERDGLKPVNDLLKRISEASDHSQLAHLVGEMHRKGINTFFRFEVVQDIKNSTNYICWLEQSGLGLPDRDYYTKSDDKAEKIRNAYKDYVNEMFTRFGIEASEGMMPADKIMLMEMELAHASMTRTERRDREKQYNKFPLGQLTETAPEFPWDPYMEAIGVRDKAVREIIVAQPEFFKTIGKMFGRETLPALRQYMQWKVINASASFLNSEVSRRQFDFYGKTLTGAKEQKPRWKRVVAAANSLIGEMLAEEYVKAAFSPQSKVRVSEMVENLRSAFGERIQKLTWMSDETKMKAQEKLTAFNRKLGYPDQWKDFSRLEIRDDSYLQNNFRANEFEWNEMTGKIGKPVDRLEWEMLPQTVNAYYNPAMNEIVFPAAIMQPPFFDPAADEAVNYGAIGAVIGHEFSHGFDDQGSKFDANGNMNEWWTSEDREKFNARTRKLVDQYNQFLVEDGVAVNGELTLGENIADFAGLTIAYDAYQIYLKSHKREVIDGLTPEQRFFIGFAQVWKNNATPEYLRQQVVTDPHSPGRFRVIGPLSNMPAFYEAFKVKEGDKMYRNIAERAEIW
jgi:putative endopeptidase